MQLFIELVTVRSYDLSVFLNSATDAEERTDSGSLAVTAHSSG